MPSTRLTELLGIDRPIVGAPMAGTATAPLAAAISAAGGFGTIGASTSRWTADRPDWLRAQIRAVRRVTDRPFGVGFILSYPNADDLVAVAIAERVAALCLSFGDPAPFIADARAAGIKTLVQVQTLAQARAAAAAGADAIAAQGAEAGGHTGALGTLSFVPAAVDAVSPLPVIAAGGIADGRGLAAALMLGAEGVWMGTRFVASVEWEGEAWRKDRVAAASTDDTIWTLAYDLASELPFPDGIGGRVLRNAFTDAWHGREAEIAGRRVELQRQLETAETDADPRDAAVWAGSGAGLIHAVEPAADIVRRVVAEAERCLARWGARVGAGPKDG
ncbi:MAG: Enoyl-[acyl-carrier-protein] reductase [FMN] [uncultured Thermomicrobiales bacterium]|uniref:Enoyl-[acyl-carrier-protein] reductase [FMN] n=1 Tax=uncultured Thermomicrobiales bacterium TaxID=1645740 RepID=A0A6J4U9R3_9BACT|nr:MAG: Enoyl-[acyl-carrier-protein] reductase [FMN] [uncultured Thermomicrobiales bacterium]